MSKKSKERANKLNKALEFATSKLKAGSDKIATYLYPMLISLTGNPVIKSGETNKYFTVDSGYDGDPRTLMSHIKFKNIPDDNANALQYMDKIEEDPHSSPENYKEFEKEWHSKSYGTLAERLQLGNVELLEQIMNSSETWQMAKRSAMDSNQVLERWQDLYQTMSEAADVNLDIFDWAVQQIQNGRHGIDWLLTNISDEIRLSLSGKYSRRRHSW